MNQAANRQEMNNQAQMTECQARSILNAYISVELKDEFLKRFSTGIKETFQDFGVACEEASSSVHVSIAYAEGAASFAAFEIVAAGIAHEGFRVRANHFEILEGKSTPYDYLVLSIDSRGDFEQAIEIVEDHLCTRSFEGGFKGHVSLLRFEKGALSSEVARNLVRELNASQGAALALGRCLNLEGECVRVFDLDRNCQLQVPCSSEQKQSAVFAA